MSRQFSGPRNLSAFGRVKRRYARWSRWTQFVAVAVSVAVLAEGGLAAVLDGGGGSVRASSADHISFRWPRPASRRPQDMPETATDSPRGTGQGGSGRGSHGTARQEALCAAECCWERRHAHSTTGHLE
jgi:hypothetical protein